MQNNLGRPVISRIVCGVPAHGGRSLVGAFARFLIASFAVVVFASACGAQDWQPTLSDPLPGPFSAPRPFRAEYRFGWSGITAASAEIHLSRPGEQIALDGKVRTVDVARALWNFEATHSATADAATLRPLEVRQVERVRNKQTSTSLAFDARGVTAVRGQDKGKAKRLEMPGIFDLQTALLYIRSQPLLAGSTYKFVVFPAKDPYLITATVSRRERITVPPGAFNAIALDVHLSKVSKDKHLVPYKKFRKATVWLSDDSDRLLLRAEAEVFIGTVFAELQTIDFDKPEIRRD